MHANETKGSGAHLQGSSGKLMPSTAAVNGWDLLEFMGRLTGPTAVMRGAAAMVMLAVLNEKAVEYPGNVTTRAHDAQGSAPRGTRAEILVLLTTTQPESGSRVDAFWR